MFINLLFLLNFNTIYINILYVILALISLQFISEKNRKFSRNSIKRFGRIKYKTNIDLGMSSEQLMDPNVSELMSNF